MDSYYYRKILDYKINLKRLFHNAMRDDDIMVLYVLQVLSFFVVDADNVNKELYGEDDIQIIKNYISEYVSNPSKTYDMSRKDIESLISFSKEARVPKEINKEIVCFIAKSHNEGMPREFQLNVDYLMRLCDRL